MLSALEQLEQEVDSIIYSVAVVEVFVLTELLRKLGDLPYEEQRWFILQDSFVQILKYAFYHKYDDPIVALNDHLLGYLANLLNTPEIKDSKYSKRFLSSILYLIEDVACLASRDIEDLDKLSPSDDYRHYIDTALGQFRCLLTFFSANLPIEIENNNEEQKNHYFNSFEKVFLITASSTKAFKVFLEELAKFPSSLKLALIKRDSFSKIIHQIMWINNDINAPEIRASFLLFLGLDNYEHILNIKTAIDFVKRTNNPQTLLDLFASEFFLCKLKTVGNLTEIFIELINKTDDKENNCLTQISDLIHQYSPDKIKIMEITHAIPQDQQLNFLKNYLVTWLNSSELECHLKKYHLDLDQSITYTKSIISFLSSPMVFKPKNYFLEKINPKVSDLDQAQWIRLESMTTMLTNIFGSNNHEQISLAIQTFLNKDGYFGRKNSIKNQWLLPAGELSLAKKSVEIFPNTASSDAINDTGSLSF